MLRFSRKHFCVAILAAGASALFTGCGAPGPAANANSANSNTTFANTNFNSNTVGTNSNTAGNTAFAEPQSYQGVIRLTLETIGETRNTAMPPLSAVVARNGADRAMEFTLPTNEKVVYLEKGDMKYLVLPTRKQYAELTADAIGFEIRRIMMPEQIVEQLKALPGVTPAGEETLNGRQVMKYTYQNTSNTGTQAGTVATDSYFLIDKETNLPVRSETLSQSASGGNVQGVKALRLLTEMSDIRPEPDPNIFNVPQEYQKIDPEQVKAQASMIFNAAAAIIGQMMNQANVSPTPARNASPATNQ